MTLLKCVLILILVGCGKVRVDIPDTKHEVRHIIDLAPVLLAIQDYCRTQFPLVEDQEKCYDDLASGINEALNKYKEE